MHLLKKNKKTTRVEKISQEIEQYKHKKCNRGKLDKN